MTRSIVDDEKLTVYEKLERALESQRQADEKLKVSQRQVLQAEESQRQAEEKLTESQRHALQAEESIRLITKSVHALNTKYMESKTLASTLIIKYTTEKQQTNKQIKSLEAQLDELGNTYLEDFQELIMYKSKIRLYSENEMQLFFAKVRSSINADKNKSSIKTMKFQLHPDKNPKELEWVFTEMFKMI